MYRITTSIQNHEFGLFLAFCGVAAFSLTLPLTRALVDNLSYMEIGIGRSIVASIGAISALLLLRANIPNRSQIKKLFITSIGISYGFPILTAVGMQSVPSSHGAVILGALTLVTALFGAFLSKTSLSRLFLINAFLGFLVVAAFSFTVFETQKLEGFSGHLALMLAVVLAGLGYAQGGILAKEIGGILVICWTLVISIPILLLLAILFIDFDNFAKLDAYAWQQFLFLSFVNSLIGFFFWFKGMAIAGVSAASQVQLLQPFLTYVVGVTFLNEAPSWIVAIFSILIVVIIAFSQWISKKELNQRALNHD